MPRAASIAFRQPPGQVEAWCATPGFFATPYGRGVWVSLSADRRLAWRTIARLVEGAYREVALKRMIAALPECPTAHPAPADVMVRRSPGGRGRWCRACTAGMTCL
jgi:hypothetical protein